MDRRRFLTLTAAAAIPALAAPARGQSLATAPLRGAIDATEFGVHPGDSVDQTAAIQAALDAASAGDAPLFLPAGRYLVADLRLPARTRVIGVAGSTVLAYTGGDHFLAGNACEIVRLSDLVIDGANRPLGEYIPGALFLADCADVLIERCRVAASTGAGIAMDRCGGRIRGNDISGAVVGIRAVESTGLSITDNSVTDCGDGGILVYRWEPGADGTIVTGNRVERIGAASGGTGQYGNGINVYQAHGVIVAQNRIADCAFTAVRANSANAVQILGNNCSRLGEMAIYSEFAFEGATIADNVIDTAASGISVANFIDGGRMATVSGNLVRNLTGSGPYPADLLGFGTGIYVEADAAVSGNVIDTAALAGIWLGWGPYLRNVTATGNVIRGARVGIAVSVVEGVGASVVANNVIAETVDGAIFGYRWAERVTQDLGLSGSSGFSTLLLSNNQVAS